jgi:hypothetical protein
MSAKPATKARTARSIRRARLALSVAMFVGASASPSLAQAPADTPDTTARLIQLLVQKGVLSKDQASDLLTEARKDARPRTAARPAGQAAKPLQPGAAAEPSAPVVPEGTVRVTYVPKAVRDQIAGEVKEQLITEAQSNGGWAKPDAIPGWTQRIQISGDLRIRGERTLFDNGNSTTITDYQSINGLANGYDNTGAANPPLLNTREDRTLFRVRARVDFAAKLADWVKADVRIGTGNDTNPVSLNQTFGQPGDFSKYNLWLDRAYIRLSPVENLTVDVGRAPNPFWTSNLLFSDSLNFDGISAQYNHNFGRDLNVFVSGGAFPVYNTAFNFGTAANTQTANVSAGYNSRDAYLFAAQVGANYHINDDYEIKGGLGLFDFDNVQGKQSSLCVAPTAFGSCNTDNSKASFLVFGNSVYPIRQIAPSTTSTITADPQFYGLASRFDVLDVHGAFTIHKYAPIDIVLDADFVKNFGFNKRDIVSKSPPNNLAGTSGRFVGGDTGYNIALSVGHQKLEKLWDWNASIAYKYIQSDAVLDALNDNDFHLGGTNAKGYIINGNLALANNVWVSGTWLSANQVSGLPYAVNVLLVDLNAKF